MRRLEKPVTIFEYRAGRPMPDYFVERYEDEISAWGANFGKIGPVKHILLREGGLSAASPNPENGAVLYRVGLVAEISSERRRVTVRPLDEQSEALIARHCERMIAAGVPSRARLVEPERAGIPILPKIVP